MIQMSADEARVLGVLIEKQLTTPEQYPLSLNAIVNGANQKNNRDPVLTMTEDEVQTAVESLMDKKLAIRVDQMGARVPKFKHAAIETLHCRTAEVAILAELLLRGPQTLGELRSRASRMAPFESLERVTDMIRALRERPEPYVQEIAPMPGTRAERYIQLLAPDAHPQTPAAAETQSVRAHATASATSSSRASAGDPSLQERVNAMEAELKALRASVLEIRTSLGMPAE